MKSFEDLYNELCEKHEHYIYARFYRRLTKEETQDDAKVNYLIRKMDNMAAQGDYDTMKLL